MFAVELETLAMRAFGDLSSSAHLQLVCDRFIAGQMECSLRRHLDSVEPGTPIRDIVDRCRVWESHAEDTDCWGARPIPHRPLPVYRIDDEETKSSPDVSSEDQDMLGSLMRHLLPTPAVLPLTETSIPSEFEQLLQRLMGEEHPVLPLLRERSGLTDMEVLLQSLLPVGSLVTERPPPSGGRQGSSIIDFSCGESGHAASRCPTLDNTFPFLPPGWQANWMGDGFWLCEHPRRRRTDIRRETSSDPGRGGGGGAITQISNNDGPQIPVISDNIPGPTARDVVVSCVGAVRPLETVAPLHGVVRDDVRHSCSDSEASDDDVLSVGALAPIDRPAVWCAWLDDFDWIVPDCVPDKSWRHVFVRTGHRSRMG